MAVSLRRVLNWVCAFEFPEKDCYRRQATAQQEAPFAEVRSRKALYGAS
jgi:hypothetical protein